MQTVKTAQKASNENTDCISYFSVAAINYPDQKQLRGRVFILAYNSREDTISPS